MKSFRDILFYSILLIPSILCAQKSDVVYSGLFTSGSSEKFPLYTATAPTLSKYVADQLQKLQSDGSLQFNLQFETNSEMDKWDIQDPFSLGFLITRDDITSETFRNQLSSGELVTNVKNIAKVGLVVFAYQTVARDKKRNIVYTAQFLGYDSLITGDAALTGEAKEKFFMDTFCKLFHEKAVPKIKSFGVGTIIGAVSEYRNAGNKAIISVGSLDGVEVGHRVSFGDSKTSTAPFGTVQKVDANSAEVSVTFFDAPPIKGDKVSLRNLRGLSSDIYQVTNFTVTSKKADSLFTEEKYAVGEDIAQYFTDFLATEKGKVVLPARTGSWITGSVEQAEALLVRDGQSFSFAMPKPTHPITLTLTGMGNKIAEQNSINIITGFKGWLQCDIPTKTYTKETDISLVKRSVTNVQQYKDFDVYKDLLFQLTKKSVGEFDL